MTFFRFALIASFLLSLAACGDDGSSESAEDVVVPGCTDDEDCEGGRCVTGLPDGLCTRNCTGVEGECPEGTVCIDTEAVGGICLFPCATASECLDLLGPGYTCDGETELATGADILVCIDS